MAKEKGGRTIMKLTDLKVLIQNKAKLIFVIGLLGALIGAGFKFLFTPRESVLGDFIYTRVLRVENVETLISSKDELNYGRLMMTQSGLLKFIEHTDRKIFDFSRINNSWARMSQQDKINWIRKRFSIYDFRDNVFEVVFVVSSSNNSDPLYLKNNAEALVDRFVDSGVELVREIKPHAVVKTMDSSVIIPNVIKNDKKKIAIKNAIYGFAAGVFFSIAVLIGRLLFKANTKE